MNSNTNNTDKQNIEKEMIAGIHTVSNIIIEDGTNEVNILKNVVSFMNKLEKNHMDILVKKVKDNEINVSKTNSKTNTAIHTSQ